MSEDTIVYDPLGIVTVTFDGNTYRLGRPKFGQWRYFQRKLNEMAEESRLRLDELQRKAAEAEDAQDVDAARVLGEEARAFARQPFYERTIEWMREAFTQVGDPLPENVDDWPAWLAGDSSIPNAIIQHWRSAPKASGSQNGN